MEIVIRRATLADAAIVAGFNTAMALETEHLHLDRHRTQLGVESLLAEPARGFYILAECGGVIAGQLMITYEWSDWRNGNFWWIQSVYVRPDCRGQGVYRQLYRWVLDQAREAGNVCGIRLYVEKDNQRAQQVYERMGMQRTPYQVFEVDFVLQRS
ncbi:MAG: GNAT family N-acetyltransferase [Acidobacteriia bacterium]|nr:GNAT family N-acetyltransferase [Terriglobia bacterium]